MFIYVYFLSYNAAVNQDTKGYLLEQLSGAAGNEYSPKRLKREYYVYICC